MLAEDVENGMVSGFLGSMALGNFYALFNLILGFSHQVAPTYNVLTLKLG